MWEGDISQPAQGCQIVSYGFIALAQGCLVVENWNNKATVGRNIRPFHQVAYFYKISFHICFLYSCILLIQMLHNLLWDMFGFIACCEKNVAFKYLFKWCWGKYMKWSYSSIFKFCLAKEKYTGISPYVYSQQNNILTHKY